MKHYISLLLFFITLSLSAQHPNAIIRKGNDNYKQSNYLEAEKQYRKALEKNKDAFNAQYNLGNALYKQKRYKEAAKLFDSISKNKDIPTELKKKMHYNMGNSYLNEAVTNKMMKSEDKQDLLKKSIEGYKNALKIDSKDKDAKYNLSYAQKLIRVEQQKQNQQNKDKKDQQNKQNQQNQQNNKNDKKDDDKKEGKQQQPSAPKMSKEDAERMLKAMQNKEKQNMEKTDKKEKGENLKNQKDW